MKKCFLATLALSAAFASSSSALEYNAAVTSFLSSGNPSEGWTTSTTVDGLTLGLRARNIDNNSTANSLGEYGFSAGYSTGNDSLALWNYEFSISGSQVTLDKYNFYLGIDADATELVNYQLSLINPISLYGNAVGTSGGLSFIQGSLNIVNYIELGILSPDPNAAGIFDYRLYAVAKPVENSPLPSSGGNPIAQNSSPVADVNIQVRVESLTSVPDTGSTFAFLGLSLAGLATVRRRVAV